jgi:hypothetical protein
MNLEDTFEAHEILGLSSEKDGNRRKLLIRRKFLDFIQFYIISFIPRAGNQNDDLSLPRGSTMVFLKIDMGQTNKQQRHFNEWPISELLGEVDSIQTRARICNPFKKPRNRFPAWRNRFLGIDFWAP